MLDFSRSSEAIFFLLPVSSINILQNGGCLALTRLLDNPPLLKLAILSHCLESVGRWETL